MKVFLRPIIYILFIFVFFSGVGQNITKTYDQAEIKFYDEKFAEALKMYKAVKRIDSTYLDTRYKIEICSLLSVIQYQDMSRFNAYESNMARKDKFYYYWQGRIFLEKYKFDEAMVSLKRFLKSPRKKSEEVKAEARRWIKWAQSAKQFMDNPEFYEVHLLESGVNSVNAELSPVFFAEKEELLFLSNRDATDPEKFEIYHSIHQGNRVWSEPTVVQGVGTFTRENANIEVVAEDGRLFQFRTSKGGDLFYSEPTESKNGWSKPEEFDSKITTTHLSSHFFINEREDRIIFAKDVGSRKEPNLDLFQSFKSKQTGKWSNPKVFASSINSEFNEDSPYLTPDEKTLYFASDGHQTMGGYDIFKTTFDSTTLRWSEPVSVGFPINSPDDEIHFKLNPDQQSGYFTSNRLNTFGDYDIFFFWEIHTIKIKGKVIDRSTGKPVTDARIYFRPYEYTDMYFFSELDANGEYVTEITADDVFKIEIKTSENEISIIEDFEIHSTGGATTTYIKDFYIGELNNLEMQVDYVAAEDVEIGSSQPEAKQEDQEVLKPQQVEAQQISQLGKISHISDRVITRNVYFEFGDTKVTEESVPILEAVKELLQQKPSVRIEVAGHTDNIGNNQINQVISEKRAETVRRWLIENGISPDRVQAKGYGEDLPLASNDDEFEGRELNRRIEFVLLK